MACNTVRMNNKGRGICSTCNGEACWSVKWSHRGFYNIKLKVENGTDQLIQGLCKNLLREYLPLLKTCIACICNLNREVNHSVMHLFNFFIKFHKKRGNRNRRHAFFKGIPSLSGSIPWMAINTSAGVSTGLELDDPWLSNITLI